MAQAHPTAYSLSVLVGLGSSIDIDFPTVRQSKANVDLIKPAGPMMAARPLDHDSTSRQTPEPLLQPAYMKQLLPGPPKSDAPSAELDYGVEFCGPLI